MILNQYIWALCNQTISLFVLNFINTCLAAHFWVRAIWFAHWALNIPTGTTIRFWQNLFPVWQGFATNNWFMRCNKQKCERPSRCSSYWKAEISHTHMCKVTYAIMNSSELLLKATRVEKSSDFSSENWVRIYSSVPEVSNVKTLTLRENLPASKPWTSFSNSRLTCTESICLNHLQASAKASLGHPLPLWQEESVSGLGLSAQNVKNTSSF